MSTSYDTYIGQKFGRWTVLGPVTYVSTKSGSRGAKLRPAVLCRCDCTTERVVMIQTLKRKDRGNPSCGCWKTEYVDGELLSFQGFAKAHGMSKQPLYKTWLKIRRRCYSPQAHNYKHYGGRGIVLCDEWREDAKAFITWVLENLGPKPKGKTLDRIDNNGNYKPGNLRWATQAEQNANKRLPNGYNLHN